MTLSSQAAPVSSATHSVSDDCACWSCGATIRREDLFCGPCGRIQRPPREVNYFEVFGLSAKLNLNAPSLEREFYRLSRKLHPDVFARATAQEQEWSLANSSLLNDAYRTLKDPIKRTEYLLKLEGVVKSDGGADEVGAKKEDRMPPDLLEEVFELNMQLDEMRMNRQIGEEDLQLLRDLLAAKENFDAQLKSADETLANLWNRWDESLVSGDEKSKAAAIGEMAALLDRRRYIRNLVNSVDEALAA